MQLTRSRRLFYRLTTNLLITATLICLFSNSVTAESIELELNFDSLTVRQLLLNTEQAIKKQTLTQQDIDNKIHQINQYRPDIKRCITELQRVLSENNKSNENTENKGTLENFGALEEPTPNPLSKERQKKLYSQLANCQLLGKRSAGLLDELISQKNTLLLSSLQVKQQHAIVVLNTLFHERQKNFQSVTSSSATATIKAIPETTILWLSTALFIGLFAAIWFRRQQPPAVSATTIAVNFSSKFAKNTAITLRLYTPIFFPLLLMSISYSVILFNQPTPVMAYLLYTVTGLIFSVMISHMFLNTNDKNNPLISIQPYIAKSLLRRLYVLMALVFVSVVTFFLLREYNFSDSLVNGIRLLIVSAVVINIIWLITVINRVAVLKNKGNYLRYSLLVILVFALIAEWIGYLNLSNFMLMGFVGTLLASLVWWLSSEFSQEVYEGLDNGTRRWHRRVREYLLIADHEPIPGLLWFRLLTGLIVLSLTVAIILKSWGLSTTGFFIIQDYIFDGFKIGNTSIVPIKILLGILLFAVIVLCSKWIKSSVIQHSTTLKKMEFSARETLVTLVGYISFCVAVVIGLSTAGFNFQNLAIVAGALSVGIGFGLQNIVNNFVSGIILLFERPIRRGDWIIVGGTEGVVKNINVRSTLIRTWDNLDIIVPNSELISSQVSNWTLTDTYGRLICPIGVAYGSDTALVKQLLLDVANHHEEVIKKTYGDVYEPMVIFNSFGDSALNFELRCFIRNITKIRIVVSDINFAIDNTFREHNISIPFPQRDIHIHSDKPKK
ncbi:MAG: potassium efflux system protein [Enterobacterales bacterium]